MWQNTPDFVAWVPQIGDILWQITFILGKKWRQFFRAYKSRRDAVFIVSPLANVTKVTPLFLILISPHGSITPFLRQFFNDNDF
ncbi:hypothetical protein HMPREF0518_2021 [Lactobacillus helveticus DSM 20075 = CGMCC 1.1877]|nr:hypothetical protein HMPREF0518_2021 [Lactobacillus helveticus DSM 20075 = CGMCC 1.1877]